MKTNELYPIFLKVSQLNVLIVGGGNVAYEKLGFLLKSSPNAKVTVVAKTLKEELRFLVSKFNIKVKQKAFSASDLNNKHIVIAATNDKKTNREICLRAKERELLVNVADTPALCDFYLGGIVTKGHVKIAISTNGKSPAAAGQLRRFFESVIPEDINDLVLNLNEYREQIKGDFKKKVSKLNNLTKNLIANRIDQK